MKFLFSLLFLLLLSVSYSQTLLIVPDTLSGSSISLNMHKDSVQFFPNGPISQTYAYNNYKYLGPTLILRKGTNVSINVNNQISDTTTVHWHGLHVPSIWDGGPHTTILPNNNWNPQFTIMDNASTYWYHPHLHTKTTEQAIKGAAGLIIVKDPIEAALNLPRTYGIDDYPIIAQVQQYDINNQAMPLGMQDSTILINGARANNGYSVFANLPAQVVRLRLLNASGERVLNFGLSGNINFSMIASDGGLLDNSVILNRIRLAPGERAEILVDLTGMNGQTIYLMSYASELAMGVQGGPTMPMPNGPPMDSPLNGIDFNLMQINVVPQTNSPITTIPNSLTSNNPYNTSNANITRTIRFTADSLMVMDGPFYFNNNSYDMMRIDYDIPINNTEIWKLVNETMVAHPFHIHDVQFFLIERSGFSPAPEESGRKDVVLVPPGDSVMFITKFEDFADTVIPYMYHCHILMHEDDGMMGQFIVRPNAAGIINNISSTEYSIYPNPTSDLINIKFEGATKNEEKAVSIYDLCGKVIFTQSSSQNSLQVNTNKWTKGMYNLKIESKNKITFRKIIVN